MCGGNLPAAVESADLVAVIHPSRPKALTKHSRTSSRPKLSGRLRLSNANTSFTTTSEFQLQQDLYCRSFGMLNIHIHRFGQPLSEHDEDGLSGFENPVMHSFHMDVFGAKSAMGLGRRLDLGVGGEGVIGRTVSITDGSGGLLGQGIIGRI